MDEQWWRENGRKVKARLTRAERLIEPDGKRFDPRKAAAEAYAVDLLMREHGYPDWWSRVQRLMDDASVASLHGRRMYG